MESPGRTLHVLAYILRSRWLLLIVGQGQRWKQGDHLRDHCSDPYGQGREAPGWSEEDGERCSGSRCSWRAVTVVLADALNAGHEKSQGWMAPGSMLGTWETGRSGLTDAKVRKTMRLSLQSDHPELSYRSAPITLC